MNRKKIRVLHFLLQLIKFRLAEIAVMLGFLGLATGSLILFNNKMGHKSVFHEFQAKPKELALLIIKDTSFSSSDRDSLRKAIVESSDSLISSAIQVQSIKDSIGFEIGAIKNGMVEPPLLWSLAFDPSKKVKLHLSVIYAQSDIDFFNKYPALGMWSFIWIASFALLFMIIFLSVYFLQDFYKIFNSDLSIKISIESVFRYILLTLVIIIGYYIIAKLTFYDKAIVDDTYFYHGFLGYNAFLEITGYTAAAICLSGFLLAGYSIKVLEKNVDESLITPLAIEKYKFTQKKLNSFFIISALLLTILVFQTGSLHYSFNTIEFIKLLKNNHLIVVNSDLVLINGALHTLLLLIYYIPTKLVFNAIKERIETKENSIMENVNIKGIASSGFNKDIEPGYKRFPEWLLTLLPLLVTIIQSLLDIL